MKTLGFLLVLAVAVFAGDHKAEHHGKKKSAEHNTAMSCELAEGQHCISLSVPTAQCGNCEKIIKTAVENLDGVDMVQVSAEKKTAHVHYQAETVSEKEIKKAIAAAGYDVDDVKRSQKAHATLPACCQSERQE